MIGTALAVTTLAAVAAAFLRERGRRRDAERALRRYRDFDETASAWSWETDTERRFSYLSDRFVFAAGTPVSALLGRSIAELDGLVNLEAEAVHDIDDAVGRRAAFTDHVLRVTTLDGRVRYWRASGKPFYDQRSGAYLGYRGTVADVTEAVAREDALTAALRRAEAAEEAARWARIRLLDAIDVIPAGFALWDNEDRLVLCNARFRELYHKIVDLLVPGALFEDNVRAGVRRAQFLMDDDRDPESWVAERVERHRAGSRVERRLADGRWIQIDDRRTVDGGIVSIHVDVTDVRQREAAERGREKLAALGQLAGGVAHEINNLLQPAIIFPTLISERLPPEDTESREDLAAVLDSARKAREIVRNILLFARKEEPKLAQLELAAEVGTALRFVRDLLPPTVTIVEEPRDACAGSTISANRTQLTQVLTNLVVNAAQAMKDHGTITVAVAHHQPKRSEAAKLGLEAHRRYLSVSISDTGCGMDAQTQARIFEPFFTTKPVGQGTGLGLSVVFAILQSWGGTIVVRSAPGEGSTFTLYLPELATAETTPPPSALSVPVAAAE